MAAANQKIIWAVVPAAGVGARMQTEVPKQYLALAGQTVLEHSLHRLSQVKTLAGIIVALKEDDVYWPTHKKPNSISLHEVVGGQERCHSVFNAVNYLSKQYTSKEAETVWVLVHDAARPCVRINDIERLINVVAESKHGGLLAMPVRDTMKKADSDNSVKATVERDQLWHALTPQYFRLDILKTALESAIASKLKITDESQVMEYAGFKPLLVKGSEDNIKITKPEDLVLAELYLQYQSRQEGI